MKRPLLASVAVLAVFLGGYVVGQSRDVETARASIWADNCIYSTETEYFTNGGSATLITALVADWDSYSRRWTSVTDYAARQAVSSFECERQY